MVEGKVGNYVSSIYIMYIEPFVWIIFGISRA